MTLWEFFASIALSEDALLLAQDIRGAPERERSAFLPIIVDERLAQPKEDRNVLTGQAGMTALFPMVASSMPLIRQLLQGSIRPANTVLSDCP